MGLFSFFKKDQRQNPAVFILGYAFCYQFFPKKLFADPVGTTQALQKEGINALKTYLSDSMQEFVNASVYSKLHIAFATSGRAISPEEFASLFTMEVCEVDSARIALIITCPNPSGNRIELGPNIPLLSPFFTAIVFNTTQPISVLNKVEYLILGQSPEEGMATLRTVDANGNNSNYGESCSPTLANFVLLISRPRRFSNASRLVAEN
ncbi:MAG: hypothetical protein WDM80_11685 [Limisphaerales bacterium]